MIPHPIPLPGPSSSSVTSRNALTAVVEVKETWDDDWAINPNLLFLNATYSSAKHGGSQATFMVQYGKMIPFGATAFRQFKEPMLDGYWVRCSAVGAQGNIPFWYGRILSTSNNVAGNESYRTGTATLTAYGPEYMAMLKCDMAVSWTSGSAYYDEMRVFNSRDDFNLVFGNRSSGRATSSYTGQSSYVFGGSDVWSRYDMLEYVINAFVKQGSGFPTWSIGGQADLLRGVSDVVSLGDRTNVKAAIDLIVGEMFGLDWKVVPTTDGFQLYVFSLVRDQSDFNDGYIPGNPNVISMDLTNDRTCCECIIERERASKYHSIRLTGNFKVAMGTAALTEAWDSTTEAAYLAAAGSGDASVNDAHRRADIYRDVFTRFDIGAGRQNAIPLTWLPIPEGRHYTADGSYTDRTSSGQAATSFASPMAWITNSDGDYAPVEQYNIGLSLQANDMVLRLHASPNHLLAYGSFGGAASSDTEPAYAYTNLLATVALRTSERLAITWEDNTDDDGTRLEVHDDRAEYWYMESGTYVGSTTSGLMTRIGSAIILRDDTSYLYYRMAGLIAQHGRASRCHARIAFNRIEAMHDLVGCILEKVDMAQNVDYLWAPVTSVTWEVQLMQDGQNAPAIPCKTTLRTGYAEAKA